MNRSARNPAFLEIYQESAGTFGEKQLHAKLQTSDSILTFQEKDSMFHACS